MRIIYTTILLCFLSFTIPMELSAQTVEEKLALQYKQDGEFEKSAQLYQQLYTDTPTDFFYKSYIECLLELKQYDKAISFVKGVKKHHNGALKYDVELAFLYTQQNEKKKAEKLIKKIYKKCGESREVLLEVVNNYYNRGMTAEAITVLQKGKKLFTNPPMNIELAQLYQQTGEYQAMINEYLELIELGDQYIRVVQSKLQLYISNEDNPAMHMAIKNALLKKIEERPNETIYAELLYWYSIQKKDFRIALIQAKSLDKKFNEKGERIFTLANTLISNKEYEFADVSLNHIISYGKNNRFYQSASINILDVRFKKITKIGKYEQEELKALAEDYRTTLNSYGENPTTAAMMSNLAYLYAFYLHQEEDAIKLLRSLTTMARLKPHQQAEAKMLLGDVLLFKGQKWEASLLYKQVEKAFKHEPIGAEAKFKSARFFYYVGQMEWAKVQLDVLKASTSKLIANDAMDLALLIQENIDPDSTYESLKRYAKAELLIYQKKYDEAFAVLDTLIEIFPGYEIQDEAIYQKAYIHLQLGNYTTADSLFNEVFNRGRYGILADNAIYQSALLNDNQLKNKAKAKELYEIIIMQYPGSIYLQYARQRYREMANPEELFQRGLTPN